MNTNEKLEIFRKLYCLGGNEIGTVFANKVDDNLLQHLMRKYEQKRDENGAFGNFSFLLYLDKDLAEMLLERIGF